MKSIARALIGRWQRFWFEPSSPTSLGVCRVLFYGALFAVYAREDFAGWASVSTGYWRPVWIFDVLGLQVLSAEWLRVLDMAWKIALILSAIGLATRLCMAAAFPLGLYYFGLPHNFGQTYHFDALVVFVLGIFALSRAGDAWSLDALFARARVASRGGAPVPPTPPPSGEYTWPSRMVWVAMALVFFAAGASKLRRSGLEWITSDSLAIHLMRAAYHVSDADPIGPFGLWIAQSTLLTRALAATTIVVEFAFPLALVSRYARWFFVPSAFLMLVGIRVLMGPTFGTFLICSVFWVPWDRVGAWLGVRWRRLGTFALAYDGGCGLCGRTIAIIRGLDLARRVDILEIRTDWATIAQRWPALQQGACAATMHVVGPDGTVTAGFDAYRTLARVLPLGWPILPVLYVPGVAAIGRRAYAAIAARRLRLGCALPLASRDVSAQTPGPRQEGAAPL